MLPVILASLMTWLTFDFILPSSDVQTNVHTISGDGKRSRQVSYVVPGTGGGLDSCDVPIALADSLQSGSIIIVEQSAVFDRCVKIKRRQHLCEAI
jgi:hypothetical protein